MATDSAPALLQYADVVRRRWRAAALSAAVIFAVLGGVAAGLPDLYRGRALLLVDQLPSAVADADRFGQVDARLQAIKQEALSRQHLTDLVEQFNLYPKERAAGQIDDVVARAQRDVKVEITSTVLTNGNPNTVAFTVSYLGTDPASAAAVANRLAEFYVQQNAAMRSRQASQNAELLKQEMDATRERLAAQEKRVISFSSSNAGALPQQINSTMTKYTQLSAQLQALTTDQMRLLERRDTLQNQIADLMVPRANVNTSDPRVKLAQARRELDELLLSHTESHPDVKNKKAEIAVLEQQAGERRTAEASSESSQLSTYQTQLAGVNTRIQQIDEEKKRLQADLSRFDGLLSAAPVRDAQFETLQRDLASTREHYDSLEKRYRDATLAERAEGTGGEEFHVIDPAIPAHSPSGLSKPVMMAAAAAVAIVVGLLVAFVRDRFDDSIQSVGDLRSFTRVPVLAAIPRITTAGERARARTLTGLATLGACAVLSLVGFQVFLIARHSEGIARLLVR
jgi:polysaccharide chain length determinant protein (PEP-CTERM system associated)